MTIELVSFADIKAVIDLEDAAITDYPGLSPIRDNVVFAIESYLSRLLLSAEYTESFNIVSKTNIISLKSLPIASVSSVVITQQGDSESLSEDDDYIMTDYGLLLLSQTSMSVVAVTYTGGYSVSNVPNAIKRAALLQTVYEFQTKDNIGATSVSTEGGSVQTPELGLLKEVRRLLDPYKHQLAWT